MSPHPTLIERGRKRLRPGIIVEGVARVHDEVTTEFVVVRECSAFIGGNYSAISAVNDSRTTRCAGGCAGGCRRRRRGSVGRVTAVSGTVTVDDTKINTKHERQDKDESGSAGG